MAWIVQNGELTNTEFIPLPSKSMELPYPDALWRIENGELINGLIPEKVQSGAFCFASDLAKVTIPESVKYIGEFAFRNTALKDVTINVRAVYFPTSFPDMCKINYYPYQSNFITADEDDFFTADRHLFEVKEEV